MDEDTKVCPECGAEYFAHVNECSRCEAELIPSSEARRGKAAAAAGHGGLVCIADGSLENMNELAWALRQENYEVMVLKSPAGSCGGGFGIFIHQNLAREAALKKEELLKKLFPDDTEAEERLRKGLCPACGAALMGSSEECPDCGLFVGTKDDGCEGDGSCGSCGH